ncbi:MAG: ABC transporter substrate-binding protein [Betaproteobacteria bacterium]|nr:ABC transporter substrate-binding protein [Betaproteobacteria bacterium]
MFLAAFRRGMADLRREDGTDYVIDARYANGISEALAGIAAELVATQPDLLLTAGDPPLVHLARMTSTIPIVFALGSDPVGLGFAASLRRPASNVTGLVALARDLGAKRLQLLKDAFPRVAQVVVLYASDAPGLAQWKDIEEAAPRAKLRVTGFELRQAADIEQAFKRSTASGAQAVILTQGFLISSQRHAIFDRLLRAKLPAVWPTDVHAEDGGLMSYAPSFRENFRRAAGYVDKILKGAKPGDLPIEQPVKFELVVNLKTAKAMGLTITPSILVRADRVIE